MKALPWVIVGVGIGVAASVLLNSPAPRYATASDDFEDAADKAGAWGSKQRITGAGRNIAGRIKEGVGRAVGNDELTGEGIVDQVAGSVKDAAGQTAHAVSDTIRDINR